MRTLPIEIQAVPVEQIKAEMKELNYPNLSPSRKEFFKLLANWSEPSVKQVWWMRHLYSVALGLCDPATCDSSYNASLPNTDGGYKLADVDHGGYIISAPADTKVIKATYKPIFSLFEKASLKLKNPAIKLQTAAGKPVELTPAKPSSKNPGSLYVTDGGPYGSSKYFGKVTPQGEFVASQHSDPSIATLLGELSADPKGVAAKYGKMTGRCCFCSKQLTDPQSVKAGFGPTCAANYGLMEEYNL